MGLTKVEVECIRDAALRGDLVEYRGRRRHVDIHLLPRPFLYL